MTSARSSSPPRAASDEAPPTRPAPVASSGRYELLAELGAGGMATVHLARMSVTLVPPDGQGMVNLVPAPKLRRVLVTTDFSTLGNAAVRWAYALIDAGGEVIVAHVTPTEGVAGELADLYAPALPF